jgi:Putative ATPase subunit of terminase (gpP-like)
LLSQDEYTEAVELHRRGWSTARIAQRLGRDRKTVRSYLAGERTPGSRHRARDDFLRFLPYCCRRFAEDPRLTAATLFDEIATLGYPGGYSTFTRALRKHRARPPRELRRAPGTRTGGPPASAPAGGAIQFDWLELPGPPAAWGCGDRARLLLGRTCSGRWRGALAENEELPHLVEAMDHVIRRLGGSTRSWQFAWTLTTACPRTNHATPGLAEIAAYYDVSVEISPQGDPRRGACTTLHPIAHRWWSTVKQDTTVQGAQGSLDQVAARMDRRFRPVGGTGSAPAAAEGLRQLPPRPFPIQARVERVVSPQNLVHFRGNAYAVPPHLPGAVVEVRHRLDDAYLAIATTSGAIVARHRIAPRGAGLRIGRASVG